VFLRSCKQATLPFQIHRSHRDREHKTNTSELPIWIQTGQQNIKNQEARKYRRSFPHLHPHAILNSSHQYSAGKTGRTLNTHDDNEITTFQHYMLIIYFTYSFNFYIYLYYFNILTATFQHFNIKNEAIAFTIRYLTITFK
jgi:hypothetical protein